MTAASFALLPAAQRERALKALTPTELEFLKYDWRFWGRPEQHAPTLGAWRIWMTLAGRGWGKTRTGAEFIRDKVTNGGARKIALIGATQADVRDVMVLGDADTPGLLDVFPPKQRPVYIPSKHLVRFHTGARARTYSAEKSARLRGPQHDTGWLDELAAWEEAGKGRMERAWTMFDLGLRKRTATGGEPQAIITTTPKPLKLLKQLINDPTTVTTKGSTFDNWANLADSFTEQMTRLYRGTRLGRQELEAEILDDVEGALWQLATIEAHRVRKAPEALTRVIVGVDPSVAGKDANTDEGGRKRKRDDCGIVVIGRTGPAGAFAQRFVLGDYTMNAEPAKWAVEVVRAYWMHEADCVAAEANNGGELVRMAIHAVDPRVHVKLVHAARGKYTRAEPVAMAYTRGEIHHVGPLPALEDEQTTWVPDGTTYSPGRIDALVWAVTEDMTASNSADIFI